MFFKNNKIKCLSCSSKVEKKFSYCPYCGADLIDKEREAIDYGLLGKNDTIDESMYREQGFGMTEKIINSIMNSLVRNLDKQLRSSINTENAEITSLPNGVRIKIGNQMPVNRKNKVISKISQEQLEKISSLPKIQAKTSIKRLSDKIIYELSAPGVKTPQDIIISKLESGYEIKAIGEKNIFVNSLSVNLPLKSISTNQEKVFVEFLNK